MERSLRRALRNHKRARKKLKKDPVHDFRVALRRCRSLAEGFSALDPDPVWRRLRNASKRQQAGLSDLRDVQVLANWLKPLRLTAGPAGKALASHFKKQERRAGESARSSLKSFPRKRWKRWLRRLPVRAELIPVNERRLAQLLLEQLDRVTELHAPMDEGAKPGNLARAARERQALPLHGRELPAGKERGLERGTRSGLRTCLERVTTSTCLHDLIVKLARKKSLPKRAVSQCLRRVDGAAHKRRKEYVSLISPTAASKRPRLRMRITPRALPHKRYGIAGEPNSQQWPRSIAQTAKNPRGQQPEERCP